MNYFRVEGCAVLFGYAVPARSFLFFRIEFLGRLATRSA